QAWSDSLPGDLVRRHEEGGWIDMDHTTGMVAVRRAPSGAQATLDLSRPPVVPGAVVVATFHTHPNPSSEGWEPGPSAADTPSAWVLGVPCLIRAGELNRSAVGKTAISARGRPQPLARPALTSLVACASAMRRAILRPGDA